MKHPTLLACLSLSALAVPGSVEPPRFAPAEGAVLRKSFRWNRPLAFRELRSTMGGVEVPPEFLPELEIDVEDTLELVVEDEYLALGAGRPARLRRTFEEIESRTAERVAMNGEVETDEERTGTSELEGRAVVFEWDADEEEYACAFADDPAQEIALELSEDLDLRGLLPPPDLEAGASWTVGAQAIEELLSPGGDLGLEDESEAEGLEELPFEGQLAARLAAREELDGRTFEVIELEGEVSFGTRRPTDLDFVPVADGEATETARYALEVEGRLLWDAERGHARALELDAAAVAVVEIAKDPGQPGPDFTSETELGGEWTLTVDFERPD